MNADFDKKITEKRGRRSKERKDEARGFWEVFGDLYNENQDLYHSYGALGKKLEISRQAVSNYCRKITYPDITILRKIAEAYNVSTDYLLGLTPTKSPDLNVKRIVELTGLHENIIQFLMNETKYKTKVKETVPEQISSLFDCDTDEFLYELNIFSKQSLEHHELCVIYKNRLETGLCDIQEAFEAINEVADAKALARWRLEKEFSDLLTYNYNYYDEEDTQFFKELSLKYLAQKQQR